ncbi:MAG: FapA family protein [Desulfobacter sp.]
MLERIALQQKLITKTQCEKAVTACRGSKNAEVALKDYFISQGLISLPRMKQLVATYHAVKIMKKNAMFGAIAVKLGFIGNDEVQAEIRRQKKAIAKKKVPKFIGDIWLKDNTISREQFLKVLQVRKTHAAQAQHPPKKQKQPPPAPSEPGTGNTVNAPDPSVSPSPPPAPPDPAIPEPDIPDPEQPDAPEPEQQNEPVTHELPGGLILEIDERGMNAYLKKTEAFSENTSAEDILETITDNDIFYGVVGAGKVEGFIQSRGFRKKGFRIARGKEPCPGKDARIEYYFDTDHLKAGGVDEQGNIDFKDRGEIPWVEEGTLLAEKFPASEPESGVDIFDQTLDMPPITDIVIRYKAGVTLSDDELKLYAAISGHPKLSWSGNVQVVDTFMVQNDVDYETGHLDYAGNINVKGTLKAGFKVQGEDIRINTVDGGEINAQGDVTIVNGVNDARIYARGNVNAKFIQNSTVFCLGNLSVDKEIVDSTIETSGAVIIPNGEVISSEITANMGVYTRHLGTEKSVPNTLTLGKDAFTSKEMKTIRTHIARCEKTIEQILEKTKALQNDIMNLHQSTGRLAHELDMARDEGRILNDRLAAEKEGSKEAKIVHSQIHKNKALFSRLDKDLNRYFDRIEKNENRILEMEVEHGQLEDDLEDLNYELANFSEWMETNPGLPMAAVTGRVTPGTMVKGPNASKEIAEKLANVKLKEVLSTKPGEEGYDIQIHENIKQK